MSREESMKSLIERAAQVYDFGEALRKGAPVAPMAQFPEIVPVAETEPEPVKVEAVKPVPAPRPVNWTGEVHPLDRDKLDAAGYLDPSGRANGLAEEYRIVKRQVLASAFAPEATASDRLVLLASAHPGDGKTWTTINLALSLSAERDLDVLVIDGDFGKPGVCAEMGLTAGPGFMDALADPSIDVEGLVMRTDIPSLSVLPAGRHLHNDTEILATDRTNALLERLVAGNPRRIVLFDSPPALAASAASELARHVGAVLVVVRADRTSDVALRDAVQLLSACPNIRAVLNGVKFSSSGRKFGAYYGKGHA